MKSTVVRWLSQSLKKFPLFGHIELYTVKHLGCLSCLFRVIDLLHDPPYPCLTGEVMFLPWWAPYIPSRWNILCFVSYVDKCYFQNSAGVTLRLVNPLKMGVFDAWCSTPGDSQLLSTSVSFFLNPKLYQYILSSVLWDNRIAWKNTQNQFQTRPQDHTITFGVSL